jgi:hypothetical protein
MHVYYEPPSRVLDVPGAHQVGAAMGPRALASATLADRPLIARAIQPPGLPSRPDYPAGRTTQPPVPLSLYTPRYEGRLLLPNRHGAAPPLGRQALRNGFRLLYESRAGRYNWGQDFP